MTIIDSSVWVAFFYPEDGQHAKARELLESAPKPFLIPEYILAETCTVLALRAGKSVADKFIDIALDRGTLEILHCSDSFFLETLGRFRQMPGKHFSFADTVLLLFSASNSILTFDEKLEKAIKKR